VTFLPIAQRELRIACRKRGTFVVRITTAVIALVIGGFCFVLAVAGAAPVPGIGKALFVILTWLIFAVALAAGVFVTSDSLSEEKRDGTLGLLFLTDLRGYDVVAGKFLATSLRSLYGMIAVLPVLGVTLLMGGVSGMQFWRTSLALMNALFFSLAVGLFVSSLGRDWHRVMSGTLGLLLLFSFAPPILDWIIGKLGSSGTLPHLSVASPYVVFLTASGYPHKGFWDGMLVTQVIAWTLLAIACLVVPRSWQERSKRNPGSTRSLSYSWTYGSNKQRICLRRKLIDLNPVFWLACRQKRQSWGGWILTGIFGLLFLIPWLLNWPRTLYSVWSFGAGCLTLLLYLWTASQASRFFIQARRNGLIELLVIGPLSTRQIVHGQWMGLVRALAGPVFLIVFLSGLATLLSKTLWRGGTFYTEAGDWAVAAFAAALSGIATIGNMAALAWFGMWMGLTSKSVNFATFKTVLFVQVIPGLFIMFASLLGFAYLNALFYAMSTGSGWFPWRPHIPTLAVAVLTLAKDAVFIGCTRQLLYSSFRERASRMWAQPQSSMAAWPQVPVPPPIPAPVSQ
jgi:ABC-type transport system involved in multi-copper enzyme maturation permease subunit